MTIQTEKKYDVAISFLVEDIALAQALYERLSEGLNIFFFPRNQEELAGTNGLESMRQPFLNESRLNLVLYRGKWGNTPWTGVEAAAIQEACLENHYEGVFFFMVDPSSPIPTWLPKTHIRFNQTDFSIEQAVGAVKSRVQDLGGIFKPLTAVRRAELLEAEEAYREDKRHMSWDEGLRRIQTSVEQLFGAIGQRCQDISKGNMQLRFASDLNARNASQTCAFSSERDGLVVNWHHPFSNSLDKSELVCQLFGDRLLIGEEARTHHYWDPPKPVETKRFLPSLSRARQYGWTPKNKEEFVSSEILAERLVIDFLNLADSNAERRLRSR